MSEAEAELAPAPAGGPAARPSDGRDHERAAKPYKGLESFQVEDAELFYGRGNEAEQLIAKILYGRLTILHAQSGAGKTSLLNAKIIPGLEQHGWTAARVIPQTDPIRAVTTTTLLHVLPPPDAERLSVQTAWEELGTPPSLGEMLRAYDDLTKDNPLKRHLIAPVTVTADVPWSGTSKVRAYPWFSRLLRSTVDVEQFAAHLAAFRALAGFAPGPAIDADTSVRTLVQMLTELNGTYAATLSALSPEDRDFERFFRRLVDRYGSLHPDFALVILFDQAEELFTRFVDQPTRRDQTLDWRLRWEFFERLEQLVGKPTAVEPADPPLPVRFVVSLRSEYIAQLDPVRSFAWNLDSCSYRLGMLGTREAMSAIAEPAETFGYGYTDDCYARIVKDLAREDRYVEPAQLQIVCDKLWSEHGHRLAVQDGAPVDSDRRRIGVATLEGVGGVQGILASFVDEQLGELVDDDRLEMLELLEPLVTRSGTRNVASRDDIVKERFRHAARREDLLRRLAVARIIREEPRLGGVFIEITHEFLIDPVLTLLKQLSTNTEYSRFRWALGTLQQLGETGQDARAVGALRLGEFLALHDNRKRLVLDDWVREVMLRSAVALEHLIPDYRNPRELIDAWAAELALVQRPEPSVNQALAAAADARRLGPAELRVLNAVRNQLSLTALQQSTIWRAELTEATDGERSDVEYWTHEVTRDEQRPA